MLKHLLAITLLLAADAFSDPIRIGLVTDLSGPMAFWGQAVQSGAKAAIADLKSEGIDAEVVYGDHQLQPKAAVTEATKLITVDKIRALYLEFTPTSIAVAPIAAKYNIPTVYSAAAASPLKSGRNLFKTYMDYADGCKLAALDLRAQGIKRVGILKATAEFGDICFQSLVTVFPDTVVVEYNTGDDVRTQVLALKTKDLEAVFNPTFNPDFGRMIKAMKEIQYSPFVVANQDAMSPEVYREFPAQMSKAVAIALPAGLQEFISKRNASGHGPVLDNNNASALGYLHTRQLVEALKSCAVGDQGCVLGSLASAKPQPEFGFEGWQDHRARFTLRLIKGIPPAS